MKVFLLICTVVALFSGCTMQKDRTDAEMFKLADEAFFDYIWELAIDQKLFAEPIIETRQNGVKSYKWLAIGSENNPIGTEVRVSRAKNIEPELIPIPIGVYVFENDAWKKLLGTRPRSDPSFEFLCKYSTSFCAKKIN